MKAMSKASSQSIRGRLKNAKSLVGMSYDTNTPTPEEKILSRFGANRKDSSFRTISSSELDF